MNLSQFAFLVEQGEKNLRIYGVEVSSLSEALVNALRGCVSSADPHSLLSLQNSVPS